MCTRYPLELIGTVIFCGIFRLLPLDWASGAGGFLGRLIGPFLRISWVARYNLMKVFPEKTPLGKYTEMYYVSADGTQNLIWDNGDYIFELSADGLSKEETKALALSVRKEK